MRQGAHGLTDPLPVGDRGILHRVGDGNAADVGHGDPDRRGFQLLEGRFADERRHLGAEAHGQGVLVDHAEAARPAHGGQDRVAVERQERPKVEDLRLDAFGRQGLGRGH